MKIGARLITGFVLILTLTVISIIVGTYEMSQTDKRFYSVITVSSAQDELTHEMLVLRLEEASIIRSMPLLEDNSDKLYAKNRIKEVRNQYDSDFDKVNAIISTDEGKAILAKISDACEKTREINDKAIEFAFGPNMRSETINIILNESNPAMEKWQTALLELNQYETNKNYLQYGKSLQSYTSTRKIIYALGGASILFSLLISFAITRSITKPLDMLEKAASKAALGDLAIEIPVDNKDEIGKLAKSFKKMLHQIRELLSQVTERNRELIGILDHLPGYAFIKNSEGFYIMASKEFCDAVGLV